MAGRIRGLFKTYIKPTRAAQEGAGKVEGIAQGAWRARSRLLHRRLPAFFPGPVVDVECVAGSENGSPATVKPPSFALVRELTSNSHHHRAASLKWAGRGRVGGGPCHPYGVKDPVIHTSLCA